MKMKVTKIHIKNFRLLKDTCIDIEKTLSLIIGKNNCGKTSVLSAMNKFIGEQSSSNNFTYDDFNSDFKAQIWKVVETQNYNWPEKIPRGIELYLYIECEPEDNLSNVEKIILDLEPDNNVIVLKFEYAISDDDLKSLKEAYHIYKDKHKNQEHKFCFEKFMSLKHRRYFQISKKSVLFDITTNEIVETEFRKIDPKIVDLKKIISFKYISARRNPSNAENDTSLSALSSRYYEHTNSKDSSTAIADTFEHAVTETDISLSAIYDTIFDKVISKIKKFGGIKENDTVVRVISTLSQQQLLRGNTTVVYEDHGQQLPETYNGLGYLNLISMIFEIETILSSFRCDTDETAKPADINLLFIEEPEAHTHPQMQYVFIKNIKSILISGSNGADEKRPISLQSIITTHSAHIVSECDFDDVKYFQRISSSEVCSKNLKDLESKYRKEKNEQKNHYKFLKQYLTLNRSDIFFADKAILFEGDTERILLPAMMKKIDQADNDDSTISLLSQNISLMEVGNYSQIFDDFLRFIGIKVLIITDLDAGKEEQTGIKKNGLSKISIVKAEYNEATHTTNDALKHFYKKSISESEKNSFEFLTTLSSKEKVLEATSDDWVADPNGNVMLVFQVEEKNDKGESYIARSFEDAFFHVNREFILSSLDNFPSLKHKEYFEKKHDVETEYEYDAYQLATKCIQSKPSFAMDILLNSLYQDGNNYSNWQIPLYIKEGLEWLKK